jgi:uncharacterized membrane protein YqiK
MPYTATQKLMIVAVAVLAALILMFSMDRLMRPAPESTVAETSPAISASASSSPSASATP